MFLQIHYLTSYHSSLLNRDDAGLAKRIQFGGAERLRVSSQSLKRHWRQAMMAQTKLPSAYRTRYFFDRQVKRRLVEQGMPVDAAHELTLHLGNALFTSAGDKSTLDKDTLMMKQPILFGKVEADYLASLIQQAYVEAEHHTGDAKKILDETAKNHKDNFKVLLRQAGYSHLAAGFEGALFGRFVTSDILTRVDAPVHVAHAFTTHALDTEVDYFTAVDDLAEGETGAAHAGDMELGAGIFYGYVAVDIPLLVSNVTGAEPSKWQEEALEDVQELLRLLIQSIAQVSPGAKLGATAPYAFADLVLLEIGTSQPRSLANAYLKPVDLRKSSDAMETSIKALEVYLNRLEAMYGDPQEKRYVASTHQWSRKYEEKTTFQEAIDNALLAMKGNLS
ncbi:MAG: CRISPR-associated protein, Cse4 family [Candidatus Carbobacillus altaicus]|uniref:CRISPR-associated protein, Cse4 family n=1 Tax=Candidatus Carbonibacillus altaicus TaxID=2163959 RepID=A0A2R6XZD4_9BACL|nr:MAG: CRISPR-associated protein, Cse4 family [Candidatus Carbobacillus altaicus]